MVMHDPTVLQQRARRLHDRATVIVHRYAIAFGIAGLLGAASMAAFGADLGPGLVGLCALLCGVVGAAYGQARGFELRLQARLALCQLQIQRSVARGRDRT